MKTAAEQRIVMPGPDKQHSPVPRFGTGTSIAFLSYGFRPFFLFGALYAGLIILVWLPLLSGRLQISTLLAPVDWHVHELMFGYVAAIVTGFLLTAIPNWTGRLPVNGLPLLGLLLLWLAGRAAVLFSAYTGWLAAALIDCAFLLAVAAAAAKEIIAGRNWRNLKVLAPVSILLLANILFHAEVQFSGTTDYSRRLAIAAVVVLIMIIGGRIVPSFTHNWILRENPGRLPVSFNRFDGATIVVSVLALLGWTLFPETPAAGTLLLGASAFNLIRLARWAGDRTGSDALVLILHVAYLFVPLGLFLAGIAALDPVRFPPVAAVHAFGVGAIGSMTLAVMTRATLGHTGHALQADRSTQLIFAAIVLAALLRIASAFLPAQISLLHLSATLWAVAFLGYCARYGAMLLKPKAGSRGRA